MTPYELAKAGTEHAHQRAIFAYCACAALYGPDYAGSALAYDHRTRDSLVSVFGPPRPDPRYSFLFAIHNQGHGDAIRGNRAKAEGVKSGVPDMFLPVPHRSGYCGLFIELKRPKYRTAKNGGRSEAQIKWGDNLKAQHYAVAVAYGWEETVQFINEYLKGLNYVL